MIIWAKDSKGTYRVFPYHLLETWKDGRLRISYWDMHLIDWYEFEERWLHLFEPDPNKPCYILKKQIQDRIDARKNPGNSRAKPVRSA